jgi:3-deoxy-manno-octulosonate cytidylyltransferase (CMP-KDO synthetase)
MQIIAIIPSRYDSSRFQGKPLAKIKGKPMIQWVYEGVKQSELNLSGVIVATDDERIMAAVATFGGQVMMTSPENRSGTDRVAEAAEKAGAAMEDIIINIQGDQPLLHPDCIAELVDPLLNTPRAEMSTLAYRITDESEIHNPKDVKVTFDTNGDALYFSRSPIPFSRDPGVVHDTYKHLGFYAYTRRFLELFRNLPEGSLERVEKLEQLRALEYGHRIRVVVSPHDSPEVDLPEDIARVESILSGKNRK